MNALLANHRSEIETILAKYPAGQKRSAVMPLLYLAQRAKMYVNAQDLVDIADLIDATPTEVASIVGFYTLYYDQPGPQFRIQVCTDLPCALRGADSFMQHLCERLGVDPRRGGVTADGKVVVEPVMCLAACDKAPMFQLQSGQGLTYHENQSVESALALIQDLQKES